MNEKIHNIYILGNDDDKNLLPPARKNDACLDLVAKEVKIVGEGADVNNFISSDIYYGDYWNSVDYIEYNTGVCIAPEDQLMFSIIASRSSVSKYNLVLANGVGIIDNGYRNTIAFRFKYIWQPQDLISINGKIFGRVNANKIYKTGDKIGQIFFNKTLPIKFTTLAELPSSERGLGGFGSTDGF